MINTGVGISTEADDKDKESRFTVTICHKIEITNCTIHSLGHEVTEMMMIPRRTRCQGSQESAKAQVTDTTGHMVEMANQSHQTNLACLETNTTDQLRQIQLVCIEKWSTMHTGQLSLSAYSWQLTTADGRLYTFSPWAGETADLSHKIKIQNHNTNTNTNTNTAGS